MLVQWEDDDGNLYEAGIFGSVDDPHGYVKKWDAAGRYSSGRGAHRILWQGGGPSVAAARFPDTVRERAKFYGCPKDKSIKLLEVWRK